MKQKLKCYVILGKKKKRYFHHKQNSLFQMGVIDIDNTQNKIEKAGGKIIKPTFSFPGGRRFHFSDPNGNEFAVWSE